jgi:hypothetical protein
MIIQTKKFQRSWFSLNPDLGLNFHSTFISETQLLFLGPLRFTVRIKTCSSKLWSHLSKCFHNLGPFPVCVSSLGSIDRSASAQAESSVMSCLTCKLNQERVLKKIPKPSSPPAHSSFYYPTFQPLYDLSGVRNIQTQGENFSGYFLILCPGTFEIPSEVLCYMVLITYVLLGSSFFRILC